MIKKLRPAHYLNSLCTLIALTASISVLGLDSTPDQDTVIAQGSIVAKGLDSCLLHSIKSAPPSTTIGEISALCQHLTSSEVGVEPSSSDSDLGALSLREAVEDVSKNVPFILSAHRSNFILPAVYISDPNSPPFTDSLGENALDSTEVQFQMSVKIPVLDALLFHDDSLWVGYSMRAFWQAYTPSTSRPFRETNHEPELIWETQSDLSVLGFDNASNQLVLNHQSNGQSGDLSRSWNRLIVNSQWEKDKLALVFTGWQRIKEEPLADENPDIEEYIGKVQLVASYGTDQHRVSTMLRGNLGSARGAAELTWSFPITGSDKVRGMVKYFDGYGESLIDYDARTRSFGVGFQITDWF